MQSILKSAFVEYDPDFKRAEQKDESSQRTALVPMGNIKGQNLHLFVASKDEICPPKDAQWTLASMTGLKNVSSTIVQGSHDVFTTGGDRKYFKDVLSALGY